MKKRAKSRTVVYELKPGQPLTLRQKREIQSLAAMPEDKIDTSDIAELPLGLGRRQYGVSGIALENSLSP